MKRYYWQAGTLLTYLEAVPTWVNNGLGDSLRFGFRVDSYHATRSFNDAAVRQTKDSEISQVFD